jgi:hypothetical protein
MPDHNYFANLIWQIADLLRGPYRPPQYERVMLPMTVLRRFDCVLAPTKAKVLAEYEQRRGSRLEGEALDRRLNEVAGQRFHNHSPLDIAKLKGDPDHIEKHLTSYIQGFSANVRRVFDYFEFQGGAGCFGDLPGRGGGAPLRGVLQAEAQAERHGPPGDERRFLRYLAECVEVLGRDS